MLLIIYHALSNQEIHIELENIRSKAITTKDTNLKINRLGKYQKPIKTQVSNDSIVLSVGNLH